MKKSLGSIIVIILSLVGANAFASKIDFAVKRVSKETANNSGSDNEKTSGACRTRVSK